MAKQEKKNIEKKVQKKSENSHASECSDKFCPFHGSDKLKLRGRIFEGTVIKKIQGRVVVQFERFVKIKKFERFEKRKTKLHARLPDCLKNEINIGDYIQLAETRPISKIIHFVAIKLIRKKESKE